jgi:hypothetical protein
MTKELKAWTIEDFLAECAELRDNEYTYDYERMPKGVCNNHLVEPFKSQWKSVSIDRCVQTIWRDDFCTVHDNGKTMTCLEYIEKLLKSEAPKHYKITCNAKIGSRSGITSSEGDYTEAELESEIKWSKEALGATDINVECMGYSWQVERKEA